MRGPRNGLGIAPRSSRGVDYAPEALSRSCLNSKLPNFRSCLNKQFVLNSGMFLHSELRSSQRA
eukprot:7138051-Alexandrium_andersonii.AAC.1